LPLSDEEAPTAVWTHDIEADAFPTPIWPWLLVLAILLVPLDVGVRRVALSRADFRRAGAWVGRRFGMGRPEQELVPGLAELRAAKQRSVRRADRPAPSPAPATPTAPTATRPEPQAAAAPLSAPGSPPPESVAESPGETLAERLARRRRG
ncbi:MAG: hypothetical protein ACR2GO_08730, partial [Candidatus Limnocylindria bacterium]